MTPLCTTSGAEEMPDCPSVRATTAHQNVTLELLRARNTRHVWDNAKFVAPFLGFIAKFHLWHNPAPPNLPWLQDPELCTDLNILSVSWCYTTMVLAYLLKICSRCSSFLTMQRKHIRSENRANIVQAGLWLLYCPLWEHGGYVTVYVGVPPATFYFRYPDGYHETKTIMPCEWPLDIQYFL